ncbi:hypothetical protein RB195_005137 [Necator americanus]|uniref:Potassium channel domain-containing protein n=1 Tax=Necator americanus TaxID=51031 RepID=A0ABR1BPT2_NECAM
MTKVNLEELWKGAESLKRKVSFQEPRPPHPRRYKLVRAKSSMKAYNTWKEQFMKDRCCSEKEMYKEVLIASTPHVLLNVLLIAYLLLGTFFLRYADESIGKEDFQPSLLFTFTTIMTIGYGSIYPTTDFGKICCVAYCVIGIPLLFLVLSNNGQFVVDAYWILRKSAGGKNTASKSLPLWLSVLLICIHSFVGGLLFNTWLKQMRFFDAVYCSFISISTIGYGDLVPVPDTWTHTIAIMAFLSAGVVILSTLFETFGCYLNYVHYIGRRFTGTKDVEIWFGGRMLTVQELITLVADQFGVCPRKLRTIIRDLDDILEAACDDTAKNRTEMLYKTGEVIRNETRIVMQGNGKCRTMLITREHLPDMDAEVTLLCQMKTSPSVQKLITKDAENALHALRVIHHKLNKQPIKQQLVEDRRTLS